MAASFIRCLRLVTQKQCLSSVRQLHQTHRARFETRNQKSFRILRLFASGTAGGGVSYAFLGFGKKKEEEKKDDVDMLTKTYRKARQAHQQQDFEKADQLYHQGLQLAEEQMKKEEITKEKALTARTMMYDGLADIALRSGQLENAKALLIETMKGCLQQGMENTHNAIIEMSLKLSSIFAMMEKKEEAEEGFRFCIQSQSAKMQEREKEWSKQDNGITNVDHVADKLEELEQDTAVLLGMALGSYGRFLLHERRYKEALPFLERARLYAFHTLGTNSNQYIVMLNDLVTCNIVSRHYDKAEEIAITGIIIAEKGNLEEIASLYCNLGAVHLRRDNISEAEKACRAAADFAQKFDHKMAFNMANNCLKKCKTLKSTSKKEKKG